MNQTTFTRAAPLRRTALDRGWIGALAATLLLVALATLPPLVGEGLRLAVMQAFAGVCHQMPERSPHLGGVALAVCHRCYGMYAALALGALAFPFFRRWDAWASRHAGAVLLLAALPAAADWTLGATGLWTNTPASRLFTGALFGLAAGFYFARALARPAQACGPNAQAGSGEVEDALARCGTVRQR